MFWFLFNFDKTNKPRSFMMTLFSYFLNKNLPYHLWLIKQAKILHDDFIITIRWSSTRIRSSKTKHLDLSVPNCRRGSLTDSIRVVIWTLLTVVVSLFVNREMAILFTKLAYTLQYWSDLTSQLVPPSKMAPLSQLDQGSDWPTQRKCAKKHANHYIG